MIPRWSVADDRGLIERVRSSSRLLSESDIARVAGLEFI
jgi:hypothetical protein